MPSKPFWEEKSIEEMNHEEWESLCDGCGKCCLQKLEDEDTGQIHYTALACSLLDVETCRCKEYKQRHKKIPQCIKLNPENRFYPVSNSSTTEASIHTNLLRDLYMVMGDGDLNKGWVIRIYYNPLVIWIWIGACCIAFGGIISLTDRRYRMAYLSTKKRGNM